MLNDLRGLMRKHHIKDDEWQKYLPARVCKGLLSLFYCGEITRTTLRERIEEIIQSKDKR